MQTARQQIVIGYKDAQSSRNAFMGIGLLSTIAGIFLTVTNPQITSPTRDSVIYANGSLAKEITIESDKTSVNVGLGLGLGGLAAMIFSLRLNKHITFEKTTEIAEAARQTATAHKTRYANKPIKKMSTEEIEDLFYPILSLIHEHPWLVDAVNAHSVVIVGKSGSGKSRLAMAIAMLNAIVRQGKINIGDLDGLQNIVTNCWTAGNIYGAYESEDGDQDSTNRGKEQELLACIYEATRSRTSQDQFLVSIFDEFSKYASEVFPKLSERIMDLITGGSQAARKRNQQYIYLVHGLPKGMWGLESSDEENTSGHLNNLLGTSCVLYLCESEPLTTITLGSFGQGRRAEILFWKKSGLSLASNASMPVANSLKNDLKLWSQHNLPKNLDPVPLSHFLEPYLVSQNLMPQIANVIDGSKDSKKRMLKDLSELLEGSVNQIDRDYLDQLSGVAKTVYSEARKKGVNPLVWNNAEELATRIGKVTADQIVELAEKNDHMEIRGTQNKKEIRFCVKK